MVIRATPSLNTFANPRHGSRWRYTELRRTWHRAIAEALLDSGRARLWWPRPPDEHVTVDIVRARPQGRPALDVDNLYGGLKPVLDALKHHALIADDKPSAITLTARQAISPDRAPRTEIRLSIEPPVLREIAQ